MVARYSGKRAELKAVARDQSLTLEERFQALEAERLRPAGSERENHFRTLTSGTYSYGLEVLDMAAAAFSGDHP